MNAKVKTYLFLLLGLLFGIVLSFLFLPRFSGDGDNSDENAAPINGQKSFYTCSMHPQVNQPAPGKCPICAMDLIEVEAGGKLPGGEDGAPVLHLSESAIRLAEIETAPAERKFVDAEIRLVGKIRFDETRMAYITARMPGRIDRLFVNYTGMPVKKGDHLAEVYGPELLVVQQELLQAASLMKSRPDDRFALGTVDSVREKLRLWGFSDDQVSGIEERGEVVDHLTLRAPISGVVIAKNALEGKYFDLGDRLFTIADLSRVWVNLDAYESNLALLRYGQRVEFTTEAYPGELFEGVISFIDPVLNAATRTTRLRVIVDNPGGRLKPEMFVRAIVRVRLGAGGLVAEPSLAGKWISPMHPEVLKDGPGSCDVCGMDLVPAESLGYVTEDVSEAALVIPASAPLITGKRAVVYVADPEPGHFSGREVVLGLRAGDYYLVKRGLREGERVVVKGNFKIDSALQIQAKPSMMSIRDNVDESELSAQTHCPVMGGRINRDYYTEVNGKRIYVCCPGCTDEIEKNPDKYIRQLEEAGVVLEKAR